MSVRNSRKTNPTVFLSWLTFPAVFLASGLGWCQRFGLVSTAHADCITARLGSRRKSARTKRRFDKCSQILAPTRPCLYRRCHR